MYLLLDYIHVQGDYLNVKGNGLAKHKYIIDWETADIAEKEVEKW